MTRKSLRRLVVFLIVAFALTPSAAHAQTPQPPPFLQKESKTSPLTRTWEFGGGVRWNNAITFNSPNANEMDPTGAPYQLFAVDSQLEQGFGAQLYVSQLFTSSLRFEIGGFYAAPRLTVGVSSDVEGADAVVADERVTQFGIEFTLIREWNAPRATRRNVPFVFGGGAFSRELHDGQTYVQSGQAYYGGVGLKHLFGRGPAPRSVGLRFDARAALRTGGAALDDDLHVVAVLTASVFKQF